MISLQISDFFLFCCFLQLNAYELNFVHILTVHLDNWRLHRRGALSVWRFLVRFCTRIIGSACYRTAHGSDKTHFLDVLPRSKSSSCSFSGEILEVGSLRDIKERRCRELSVSWVLAGRRCMGWVRDFSFNPEAFLVCWNRRNQNEMSEL